MTVVSVAMHVWVCEWGGETGGATRQLPDPGRRRCPARHRRQYQRAAHQVELAEESSLRAEGLLVCGNFDDQVGAVGLDALPLRIRQRAPPRAHHALQHLAGRGRHAGAAVGGRRGWTAWAARCGGSCAGRLILGGSSGAGWPRRRRAKRQPLRLLPSARTTCVPAGRRQRQLAPRAGSSRLPGQQLRGRTWKQRHTQERGPEARTKARTCRPKNLVCWFLECSRIASTRVQASGCSCTALSTASAAMRCRQRGAGRAEVSRRAWLPPSGPPPATQRRDCAARLLAQRGAPGEPSICTHCRLPRSRWGLPGGRGEPTSWLEPAP